MIKTGEEIDKAYDSIANSIGFSGRKALMPEDHKKAAKEEFENSRHLFKFIKAEHLDQITLYYSLNTGQAPRNFNCNLLKMIFEDEKLGKLSGNKLYKVYQSLHKDSARRNPQAAD